MLARAVGLVVAILVAFSMSLLLIPVAGIVFGLLKKLFV